jgi:acyl-CoA synthetase (AMP-forming)/AMP-acid ligase II
MESNPLSFKNRIFETLNKYSSKVLFSDESQKAWIGSEIQSLIVKLSQHIQSQTQAGERVGIIFENNSIATIAILSAIAAERVPVILNMIDVRQNSENWLNKCQAQLFIISHDLELSSPFNKLQISPSGEILNPESDAKSPQSLTLQKFILHPPKGTGVILYTSGSTGEPKEVFIPELGILNTSDYLQEYFSLNEQTVASIVLPICHSMALNTQLFPTFFAGGFCSFHNFSLISNKLFRTFKNENGTFISLIGDVLRVCWEEKQKKNLSPCNSVEHIQLAGGTISQRHLEMAQELFPKSKIHKGYGLTEAIRVTMISNENPLFLTGCVGKNLPFLKIQIRNEFGEILPARESGEVFVHGDSMMLGFRKLSAPTINFTDLQKFLATGDVGELDEEGNLYISGRMDSLFKIQGKRISGFEIEKIVLQANESIRFAKCIASEEPQTSRQKIILFLEMDKKLWGDSHFEMTEDLELQIWNQLTKLSVFPREIVILQQMPRTSNGKLNIHALHQIWKSKEVKDLMKKTNINLSFFQTEGSENL